MMIVALLFLGCTPDTCHEPAKTGAPAVGDANADGAVDVADGIYLQRWLLRGGPAPACEARMDVQPNGVVDLGDSVVVWKHTFETSGAFPEIDVACADAAPPGNDLECGALTLGFVAPAETTTGFPAFVTLTTPDLPVEGWQFGLSASGCSIASATTTGTVGADLRDGGVRSSGYGRVDVGNDGLVTAVALSWLDETVLAPSPDPYNILAFNVDVTPPAAGCTPCVLSFVDTLKGPGAAVRTAIVHEGRASLPPKAPHTVNVCAG